MEAYYERGVFVDIGAFIQIRLWRGGAMVRNFAILKRTKTNDHIKGLPHSVEEFAKQWGDTVAVKVILRAP